VRKSKASASDLQLLRQRLNAIRPGMAHQAQTPPQAAEIFSPPDHANALDPLRSLVVGNRGVGKSFWSAVLSHDQTRQQVARHYPRLRLTDIRAVLGFHEAAGKDEGPAPSPELLASLIALGYTPEAIWRGVLLRAVSPEVSEEVPSSLKKILEWRDEEVERAEAIMRKADRMFAEKKQIFLLVFDALDRLGPDWDTITPLTQGVLRLALDMRGYRALKAKVFMRTDQASDENLFRFADASKIRADAVKLVWQREELFGLMYKILIEHTDERHALARLGGSDDAEQLAERLTEDGNLQVKLFYRIAGEFMGAGSKRGRTYNWIVDHLADAFGDTSPRSFLTALQKAAETRPAPIASVIDHNGIRAGVQNASRVRLEQLQEDYSWISDVIGALAGLEVPCAPRVFIERWKDRNTVTKITEEAQRTSKLLPLELQAHMVTSEHALLEALKNIGVVEFRDETRINVPDIFRVEARIKRRGGVRPPSVGRN